MSTTTVAAPLSEKAQRLQRYLDRHRSYAAVETYLKENFCKDDLATLPEAWDELQRAERQTEQPADNAAFRDFQNYVTAIFRPGDTLCFAGINHKEDRRDHDFVPYEKAVSREYFDHLRAANKDGSIYLAMNTYPASLIGEHKGRTQENVVDVRALQADVDYNGAETMRAIKSSALVPQPSITVESSPGKFQGIWLVEGISKADAKPMMQAMAAEFKTDSAVAEVARVMCVPGFVNRKYDSAPVARTVAQTNARYGRGDFKLSVNAPENFEKKNPDGWVKNIQLQHGQIYNQLVRLAGYYVREHNADDADVLYALLKPHCETAVDRDGVSPFHCDMKQVKGYAEKWAEEFETKAEYEARTKLTLNQTQTTQTPQQPVDASTWRSLFRTISEMEDGPIDMIIEGALQEGTCFFGATAGDGKTLVALAFAKAISTGTPLFGLPQFSVSKPRVVIYLIPESRDRAFRKRCEAFRLPDSDWFMTRTISAGIPLDLADPRLLEAVRQTKAVVFLDTAVRFSKSNDENAATQNRLLVNDVIALLAAGAVCVVLLHHATKAAKQKQEEMTLENMLRGTGDLAAMCDQAYGIRKDETKYKHGNGPMEINLVSLKDREQIGGLTELRLAASWKEEKREDLGGIYQVTFPVSYIGTTGNFKVLSESETANHEIRELDALVKAEPNIPLEDAAKRLGSTKYTVKTRLGRLGYHRVKGGPDGASPWHKDEKGVCPFEKANVVEIKPAKKTYDLTLADVVQGLAKFLGDYPDGVLESDVFRWADKQGIPDTQVNKARKRLNVAVGKDGDGIKTWTLPAEEAEEGQQAARA